MLTATSPNDTARRFLGTLSKPSHLLIAVSGGSDSTGLLIALRRAIATHGFPHTLTAATIDHALRQASATEAAWVFELCARLDIVRHIRRWTGDKPKTGIPAAAREARYGLLAEIAQQCGADAIVTGHTHDDQIETVAMRASRANHENLGLAGMAPATLFDRRIWLLRPFLDVTREAIRDSLRQVGQSWIDDPSNADRSYERVRMRQDNVAIDFNPEAGLRRQALSQATADWLGQHATLISGCVIKLDRDALAAPPEILRHGMATLAAVLGGKPHRPAAQATDKLMALASAEGSTSLTLSGCLVVRRKDVVYMLRERRGLLTLPLPPYATIVWDGRFEIRNHTARILRIEPGAISPILPDLPGPARTAMTGIFPQIREESGQIVEPGADFESSPYLPLFDRFLPAFDVALADRVAAILGRGPTLSCPI
ncbi:tRNA(Ile)-lysidine synthase [Rhizobium sp. PDO1-076]|uniref:tRNA lysidine(34) synthetase TilS n=1 Tax=Rhizobium sp. PDO1-076 TaxID=1125979 RepID=UPI00024E3D53|nr:tRNA lysidine(34) synthetase TilS [Rhizobium sp. PDO1-076]EHS48828.1 tRNA(Ile)-lysidine synthase [Rhizobium sp. PDO1-076]